MALPSNPNSGLPVNRPSGLPQNIPPLPGGADGLPDLSGGGLPKAPPALPDFSEIKTPVKPDNDRLGNYDFGSSERPRRMQEETPAEEDDPFETIPVSEAIEYSEEEPEEIQAPSRAPQAASQTPEPEEAPKARKKRAKKIKPQAGKLDKHGQNVFVDEEKKKLSPFGGKKSVKVGDLDPRKNLKQQAKVVQYIIISGIVVLIGLGAYNAIVPKPTLTEADVISTVQETVSITNFPLKQGQGFATNFLKAYLELGADPAATTIINYYYAGQMLSGSTSFQNRINDGLKYEMITEPIVYEAQGITDTSANYIVGALVQSVDSNGEPAPEEGDAAEGDAKSSEDATGAKWQFYSVNVFYDPETMQFSITPESPSIVPSPRNLSMSKINSVIKAAPIGNGKALEDQETAKSTIEGFMDQYRVASYDNWEALEQYIVPDYPVELRDGLKGEVEFKNSDIDDALNYTIFDTDNGELKVDMTVTWEQKVGEASTTFTSRYVMTLIKTESNFLVSRFTPYIFVPES